MKARISSLESSMMTLENEQIALKNEMKILKGQTADLKSTVADLEDQYDIPWNRSDEPVIQSESMRHIRHRFIDIYLQPPQHSTYNKETVRQGNQTNRHSDAVADALLYEIGERNDHEAMKCIYGVDPETILLLSK